MIMYYSEISPCNFRHWKVLLLGQAVSLVLAIAGATNEVLATECKVSAPSLYNACGFFLVSIFGGIQLYRETRRSRLNIANHQGVNTLQLSEEQESLSVQQQQQDDEEEDDELTIEDDETSTRRSIFSSLRGRNNNNVVMKRQSNASSNGSDPANEGLLLFVLLVALFDISSLATPLPFRMTAGDRRENMILYMTILYDI